jgi:riboflavin kinase / FMN adenylyltransferase
MSIRVLRSTEAASAIRPGPVLTIGNFDGVHCGHRGLLGRTIAEAERLSAESAVLTFDPAPRDVLRPGNEVYRIQSLDDKIALLEAVGIDRVIVEPFSRELASKSPQWFCDVILRQRIGVRGVVLGWNFRFGARREGTVANLRDWLDVPVVELDAIVHDGDVASSSRIRMLVREGRVADASELLLRAHVVVGTVVPGHKRGRTLGFPTANITPETALLPAFGVYAVRVDIGDGTLRWGCANYGSKPTFEGKAPTLEVHVLDTDMDLYGRQLRVHLVRRIRDERRFDGVDALVEQIRQDVEVARTVLA